MILAQLRTAHANGKSAECGKLIKELAKSVAKNTTASAELDKIILQESHAKTGFQMMTGAKRILDHELCRAVLEGYDAKQESEQRAKHKQEAEQEAEQEQEQEQPES